MYDDQNLYYEDYDGQDASDFTLVGVAGDKPEPITDLQSQIKEFNRLKGDVLIRVYRPANIPG